MDWVYMHKLWFFRVNEEHYITRWNMPTKSHNKADNRHISKLTYNSTTWHIYIYITKLGSSRSTLYYDYRAANLVDAVVAYTPQEHSETASGFLDSDDLTLKQGNWNMHKEEHDKWEKKSLLQKFCKINIDSNCCN